MNRYFLYMVLLNMVANVVSFVPAILIKERYEGSVLAIVLAVPLGMLLLYICINSLRKFPNKSLPEILQMLFPEWIRNLILSILGLVWFFAGLHTLLIFADITKVYINPDYSMFQIVGFFLLLIIPVSLLKSDRVLYLLEILFWLNIPLTGFTLFKILAYNYMKWDSMLAVATHISNLPSWSALSAASYIFSGYTNMVIFGRLLEKKIKRVTFLLIGLSGATTLLTSFFFPIGLQGADGVGDYIYPWITSADSLRVELGFVERVLFPFLLLYASIAFMNMIIHWHVSIQLMPDLFAFTKRWKKLGPYRTWFLPAIFGILALYLGSNLDEPAIFSMGLNWINFRLGAEVFLVILLFYAARRIRT